MPTTDPRLGLDLPLTGDDFDTAELAGNFIKIRNHPGIFVCTSGTRPGTWAGSNEGQFILETDTGLLWRWNGSAFVRHGSKGHLGNNRRTTDLTVATGTFTIVAQVTATLPDGGGNIRLLGSWSEITAGAASFALFRGATQLHLVKCLEDSGGTIPYVDLSPAAGSTTYTLQVKNLGATVTVECAATSPASLDLEET